MSEKTTPAHSDQHDDPTLWLENQICFPLYSAHNALLRTYRPILELLDLTYPQYLVMLALWKEQPVTVSELGRCLFLDSGTLTPLLKRMEAKGLITRKKSAQDERVKQIELTAKGQELKKQAKGVPEQLAQKNTDMTMEEISQLKALCEKFFDQLNDR
ncbi:MAG: MarR family transcriptional regulator [Pseudomonadota bacterium]|nr:MarR family transcriptional regulator [Pseudomonadota bacterium]